MFKCSTTGAAADITEWLSLAATEIGYDTSFSRGDINLDHDVDTRDLTAMIIGFTSAGGTGSTWSTGDTDGDGDLADEVSLDDTSIIGTGYNSAIGTSENQIVLQSINGGISGAIHVHYPIVTPANPALSSAPYGKISFSNTRESTIPAAPIKLFENNQLP